MDLKRTGRYRPLQPIEFLKSSESSRGSPAFCIQSLSFHCTESGPMLKRPLCRLYVPRCFQKLVGAQQVLMELGVLALWPEKLNPGGQAPLVSPSSSCLLPWFRGKSLQAMWQRKLHCDPASRPKHQYGVPACPKEVEGAEVGLLSYSTQRPRKFLRLLEESHDLPAFSVQSLSLVCCQSCSFSTQLSCRSNCYLYAWFSILLMGRASSASSCAATILDLSWINRL